jgi:hypothetical protein
MAWAWERVRGAGQPWPQPDPGPATGLGDSGMPPIYASRRLATNLTPSRQGRNLPIVFTAGVPKRPQDFRIAFPFCLKRFL